MDLASSIKRSNDLVCALLVSIYQAYFPPHIGSIFSYRRCSSMMSTSVTMLSHLSLVTPAKREGAFSQHLHIYSIGMLTPWTNHSR